VWNIFAKFYVNRFNLSFTVKGIFMSRKRTFAIRFGIFFIVLYILSSLIGCSDDNKYNKPTGSPLPDADTIFLETASELREIAWNHLTQHQKKTVTGDWRKAKVTMVRWNDVPLKKTTTVRPDDIYKVTFNTKQDALLGPIGIYLDPVTKTIVGYDVRE
jgi:hypothetical protein